jgi:hypothetical protein
MLGTYRGGIMNLRARLELIITDMLLFKSFF